MDTIPTVKRRRVVDRSAAAVAENQATRPQPPPTTAPIGHTTIPLRQTEGLTAEEDAIGSAVPEFTVPANTASDPDCISTLARLVRAAGTAPQVDTLGTDADGFLSFGGAAAPSPQTNRTAEEQADADLDEALAAEEDEDADPKAEAADPLAPLSGNVNGASVRQRLHGITMESQHTVGYASMTLVALSRQVAVQGSCAVWPVAGAVCVGGAVCFSGSRCAPFIPVEQGQTAVVAPLPLGEYASKRRTPPEDAAQRVAAFLGLPVDWGWVERTTTAWRERMGTLPTTVLLLESVTGTPKARRGPLHGRLGSNLTTAAGPRCLARTQGVFVAPGLYATAVPAVLKSDRARLIVLGAQGVGKSTLCRQLVNGLVSRHGRCLLLDLDPGQGDIGQPGCLSLGAVDKLCLDGAALVASCTPIRTCFLGAPVIRDPLAAGAAIVALCEAALEEQNTTGASLVINTHGWVHGTGRRASIEAIRNLNPTHVVHLQLQSDEDWVGELASCGGLADPRSGLNRVAMVAGLGTAMTRGVNSTDGVPSPSPTLSSSFSLHRVAISQSFKKPVKAPLLRDRRWQHYFKAAVSVRVPTTALRSLVLLDTGSTYSIDACGEDILQDVVIGFNASSSDAPSSVLGFGLFCGTETDGCERVLQFRTPIPAADLHERGCDTLLVGMPAPSLE